MKLLNHIPAWLKNKYFLSLTGFIVWMLFFDPRDIFTQVERTRELKDLQSSKRHYEEQIAAEQFELQQLKNDPGTVEKYAREKYLMKKEDEDIFIISEIPDPVDK